MTKTELNKKTSEFIVTVEADKKSWKEQQNKAEKALIANLSLKGFRKGKVPTDIAKKHITKADIFSKAIREMLDEMVAVAAKEITKDIIVLDAPTYAVKDMKEDKLVVDFLYPVYPEVKLGKYKELGIKYEETKVDAKVVNAEIEKVQNMKAMLKEKKGAIAKGDIAIFDFEGFIGKEAFEGGKAEKYELEIGSGQFIPGFEDQMIGLKKGDKKDIKVAFPADYHSEELKGKDSIFKVLIHEVKAKAKPELNDELAKSIGVKDVNTLAELKAYIKKVFTEQSRQQARANFQREAFAKLKKDTELVLPMSLVAKEMQNLEVKMTEDMKKQGITVEQYMEYTGTTKAQLGAQFKAEAEGRLTDALLFAELAKVEKIELKDADYDKEYEKLAEVYQQSVEGVKGMITKAQIQIPLTNDKVIDALIKYSQK